jgi:hypothetical protein
MSKRARSDEAGQKSASAGNVSTASSVDLDYAQSPAKWLHVDDESDSDDGNDSTLDSNPRKTYIECILPPHRSPWHFDNYEAYEQHVDAFHSNRCHECNCNLPSQHYLSLHISERHDPFNAIKRERGEKTVSSEGIIPFYFTIRRFLCLVIQYACLVEGCDRICSSPPKRRMHCIDKHNFPKTYNFAVIDHGVDPRGSGQLHKAFLADRQARRQAFRKQKAQERDDAGSTDRKSSIDHESTTDTSMSQTDGIGKPTKATPMDEVISTLGALNFQPRSLKFGRKHNAGLERPQ